MDLKEFDKPYEIRFGDVWWEDRHVCDGSGEMAIAFDSSDGTLHKHGEASRIEKWTNDRRRQFTELGFDELAQALTVVTFPVTPETVAEVNACISITGRVLKLTENLTRLAEIRPELLSMPRYPRN